MQLDVHNGIYLNDGVIIVISLDKKFVLTIYRIVHFVSAMTLSLLLQGHL